MLPHRNRTVGWKRKGSGKAAESNHTVAFRARSLFFEPLEARRLLAIDLIGVPDWLEQGPGPIVTSGSFQQAGAIEAIAAHPTDPDEVYVATINGGVWKTTNATAVAPTWDPLTDQFASLSMSAIAYSPLDPTYNTLFAGTGRFSSGGRDGGPLVGLLRTTDGGVTWEPIGQGDLGGRNIRSVVPTSSGTSLSDQVVLAATPDGGVFRSSDGGVNWDQVSGSTGSSDGIDNDNDGTTDEFGELNLPAGRASHIAADTASQSRFYAAAPGQGVFRSDNFGANWRQVNGTGANRITGLPASTRIEVAVHNSPGNNIIYAAVLEEGELSGLFRSLDGGANWRLAQNQQQPHPGGQGGVHLSILADSADPDVVFIMGDTDGFRVSMDDATPANDNWVSIETTNGTRPHVDSRDMVFDANNNILEADDGGIYRLTNPNNAATRQWTSVNGDIRPTEFTSVAYDSLNNTIIGGAFDNGTPRQQVSGNFNWDLTTGCDGGITQVDNDQIAHPGTTIQYTTAQNLGPCGGFTRRVVDNTNTETPATTNVELIVDGSTTGAPGTENTLRGVEKAIPGGSTIGFFNPYELNRVNPARMILGTAFLYESKDKGDKLTSLGGLQDLNSDGADNDEDAGTDEGDEFQPVTPVGNLNADGLDNDGAGRDDDGDGMIDEADEIDEGDEFAQVSAIAYGGRFNGADAPDVLYIGKGARDGLGGVLNGMSGNLVLRTVNSTNTMADFTTLTNYPGSTPRDIVLDPDDWQTGYVIDVNSRVYRFVNAGAAASDWTQITGNLNSLVTDIRTIEIFTPTDAVGDDVVLVGGLGGVYRTLNPTAGPGTTWTEFNNAGPANQLPNTIVKDLRYTPPTPPGSPFPGDVLLAGTWGRGAWTVGNASDVLMAAPVANVCGDDLHVNQDDTFRLVLNAANPAMLDIFVNGVGPTSVPLAAIEQINIFGQGGNDELIVDTSNGLITLPTGIRYDGDGICFDLEEDDVLFGVDRGFDRLTLTQTGGDTQTSETVAIGQLPGSGLSTITGPGGTQMVYFEELEPVTTTVPAGSFSIISIPGLATLLDDDNQITLLPGQILLGAGRVEVDNFEPIEFTNKANVTINAGAGDDTFVSDIASAPAGLQMLTVNGDAGDDELRFEQVPDAGATSFVSLTVSGNDGDDLIDASQVTVNTPFTLNGDGGADTLIGGRGSDTINGGSGDDLLIGGDPTKGVLSIGSNTYNAGAGFDTLAILGTLDDDTIDVTQTSATALTSIVNGAAASETFSIVTPDQVLIEAKQGDDVIRVTVDDSLFAPAANPDDDVLRFHVLGDAPNASDRLLVEDEGTGDLILVRQAPDERSGSVSIAPAHPSGAAPPLIYEGIERLDIVPQNPITGGTGTGSLGQVVVFQADPFEWNDNRIVSTDIGDVFVTHRDPTIDPGGGPLGAPGDEDWYEFRSPKIGTFRFDVFFDEIASVPSGRSGLPGNGDLDIGVYDASGILIVAGTSVPEGERAMFSAAADTSYFLRVAGTPLNTTTSSAINTYDVDLVEVDLLGPQLFDPDGAGGVDPIHITNDDPATPLDEREFDLFNPKPAARPTPLITSMTINLRDLLTRNLFNRAPGDVYEALDLNVASQDGHYQLVGDHNGVIPIAAIVATNNPASAGTTATGTVELQFANPLPDDRFTLTIFDSLLDPAGNRLDGESNAIEPQENPSFPTGDGVAGSDFAARFTVDSRAELGVWAAGSVYVDTNGNFGFDPEGNDATNEDIAYVLGFTTDNVFAGNLVAGAGDTADGFDKLAAYGRVAGAFRWLIDTDNNGVPNLVIADPFEINGLPVAGNFDGSVTNGDEVGLKNSANWYLDTDHDFNVETTLAGNMIGSPIVGDFDGDGIDDLGAWADDTFSLDLSTLLTGAAAAGSYDANINGVTDVQFRFGFPGSRERPVAADFDGDGIDDLGLWAPDRSGAVPQETSEWYIFISAGTPIPNRIIPNPQAIGGNIVDFTPVPFGNDLYAQFGDNFALPVVGNFDPPVVGSDPPQYEFATFTNPGELLDVNDDGIVTPVDALYVFNALNRGDGGLIAVFRSEAASTGPFYDPSADGYISPLDALMVINRLNAIASAGGEGEDVLIRQNNGVSPSLADEPVAFGHALLGSSLPAGPTNAPSTARASVADRRSRQVGVDAFFALSPTPEVTGRADRPLVWDNEQLDELLDELADQLGQRWDGSSPWRSE